jgi:hypothetical protein
MEHRPSNITESVIAEAFALEAEEAKQAGKVGYMARVLVQATLPHKATPGNEFTRQNGHFTLSIMAPSKIGLPYGTVPRLLLSWITTEAFFTKNPVLELGSTLSAFMAELGLSRTGGQRGDITRFRNQATRLFASTVYCHYGDENADRTEGFNLVTRSSLWWNPKEPDQMPLWRSTIVLGTDFFNEIIKNPVPIDMDALRQLKRSPMALDIYFWLTYRFSYLQKDTFVPWELLQLQFGADYAADAHGLRNFKLKFLTRLKQVQAIYDTAKAFPTDKGLLLKPSPPHVAKKPFKDILGNRRRPVEPPPPVIPPVMAYVYTGEILLRTETYEKARAMAPRLDIYYLEGEWKAWIEKTGNMPKDPDKAFLGFVRLKAKQHGN